MGIITRMRKQTAVYWAPQAAANEFGQPVPAAAIEIACRWEDVISQIITMDGREVMSKARVYVDRDLAVGGVLWLGLLADADADPFANVSSWEILRVEKLPKLNAREFLRTVYL